MRPSLYPLLFLLGSAQWAAAQDLHPLVPLAQVTHTAVVGGEWTNPATWGGASIPQAGSRAHIPAGITVTMKADMTEAPFWVRVDGVLRCPTDVDSHFVAESVVILHGGRLECGTASTPVAPTVTATFTVKALSGQQIDHGYDPFELSRGIMAHSAIELHGAPKTPYVTVTKPPASGANQVIADTAPDGWRIGDALVLTAPLYGEDEQVTITGVSGATITVSPPFKRSRVYPAGCSTLPSTVPPCRLHLANLTRNVRIQSDTPNKGNRLLQGHVMLMEGGHQVRYAGFYDLGRTTIDPVTDPIMADGGRDPSLCPPIVTEENVRGRYSLHFHDPQTFGHPGPFSVQNVVEGSVVVGPRNGRFKIGFATHESNTAFRDNVGYQIDGSIFWAEEGNEVGEWLRNLAIYSLGSNAEKDVHGIDEAPDGLCDVVRARHRLDVGHGGSNFWFHGGGIKILDNIASGCGGSCFDLWSRQLDHLNGSYHIMFPTVLMTPPNPDWVHGLEYMQVGTVPVTMIGQSAYAVATRNMPSHDHALNACFENKYHGIHQKEDFPQSPMTIFHRSLCWNGQNGLTTGYGGNVHYKDVVLLHGDVDGPNPRQITGLGMGLGNQGGNNNLLENVQVNGYGTCISPSKATTFTNVTCDGKIYTPTVPPPPR